MTRADRVALLMRLDRPQDPLDVLSWTVDGRHLSVDEVRLLKGTTWEDVADLSVLLHLDVELDEAVQ